MKTEVPPLLVNLLTRHSKSRLLTGIGNQNNTDESFLHLWHDSCSGLAHVPAAACKSKKQLPAQPEILITSSSSSHEQQNRMHNLNPCLSHCPLLLSPLMLVNAMWCSWFCYALPHYKKNIFFYMNQSKHYSAATMILVACTEIKANLD